MGGVLRLSLDNGWHAAGWVYSNALESAADELEQTRPDLAQALRGGLGPFKSMDIGDWPTADLQALLSAVEAARARRIAAGPSSFHEPEFFAGYVARLDDLVALLRSDVRLAPR